MAGWNEWVPGTNMTLSEVLDALKSASIGLDVKDKLYWSFFKVVQEAIKEGNANFDVEMAKGVYATLKDRLDAGDEHVDDIIADVKSKLGELGGVATFKGSATNAVIIAKTGMSVGDEWFDTTNQQSLRWNGTTWVAVGGAVKLGDGTITKPKIAKNAVGYGEIDGTTPLGNVLNLDKLMTGEFYSYTQVGQPIFLQNGPAWMGTSEPIPVKAGDIVRFNKAYQSGYFIGIDSSNIVRQTGPTVNPIGFKEIIVAEGVTAFYTAVFAEESAQAMIIVNGPLPDNYTEFGKPVEKVLGWLGYKEQSVRPIHLSDEVLSLFQSSSSWVGAKMITAGDSITWQDGKLYAQGPQQGQIAKGWQTHVKGQLGLADVTNDAISGRPMADGTANGVGTVSTVLSRSNYADFDLMVIASGTNDDKLNVPIGDIGSLTRTTFYGAYRTAIEHILTNNPSIKLILFTPLHRNNGGLNSYAENSLGHTLLDYREAIFKLGERFSCPVVDMFALSGISMFTLATDTMDGLHPNDSGYEKMGRTAVAGIKNT